MPLLFLRWLYYIDAQPLLIFFDYWWLFISLLDYFHFLFWFYFLIIDFRHIFDFFRHYFLSLIDIFIYSITLRCFHWRADSFAMITFLLIASFRHFSDAFLPPISLYFISITIFAIFLPSATNAYKITGHAWCRRFDRRLLFSFIIFLFYFVITSFSIFLITFSLAADIWLIFHDTLRFLFIFIFIFASHFLSLSPLWFSSIIFLRFHWLRRHLFRAFQRVIFAAFSFIFFRRYFIWWLFSLLFSPPRHDIYFDYFDDAIAFAFLMLLRFHWLLSLLLMILLIFALYFRHAADIFRLRFRLLFSPPCCFHFLFFDYAFFHWYFLTLSLMITFHLLTLWLLFIHYFFIADYAFYFWLIDYISFISLIFIVSSCFSCFSIAAFI